MSQTSVDTVISLGVTVRYVPLCNFCFFVFFFYVFVVKCFHRDARVYNNSQSTHTPYIYPRNKNCSVSVWVVFTLWWCSRASTLIDSCRDMSPLAGCLFSYHFLQSLWANPAHKSSKTNGQPRFFFYSSFFSSNQNVFSKTWQQHRLPVTTQLATIRQLFFILYNTLNYIFIFLKVKKKRFYPLGLLKAL